MQRGAGWLIPASSKHFKLRDPDVEEGPSPKLYITTSPLAHFRFTFKLRMDTAIKLQSLLRRPDKIALVRGCGTVSVGTLSLPSAFGLYFSTPTSRPRREWGVKQASSSGQLSDLLKKSSAYRCTFPSAHGSQEIRQSINL